MSSKTEQGLHIRATQRCNRDESVLVENITIEAVPRGLKISAELGHGRGFAFSVVVTLEEIVAWIPALLAERSEEAVRQSQLAVMRAEQQMRYLAASEAKAQGVELPYLPGDPSLVRNR